MENCVFVSRDRGDLGQPWQVEGRYCKARESAREREVDGETERERERESETEWADVERTERGEGILLTMLATRRREHRAASAKGSGTSPLARPAHGDVADSATGR